jgi:hypothetical protein
VSAPAPTAEARGQPSLEAAPRTPGGGHVAKLGVRMTHPRRCELCQLLRRQLRREDNRRWRRLREPRGAASTEQLMTNAAARSSSSIGSKETTKAGGPSPAHIASASGSWLGRHSAGTPAVEPGSAWAAPGQRPLPSVVAPIATAMPSPIRRCRRRRRLHRLRHPPSHLAATGTSAAAPGAAQPAPGVSPRARGR